MTTYLAEVTHSSRLGQKAKAVLLGVRRKDGLWVSTTEKTITLPMRSTSWHEKQLLLVEIDSSGIVDEVVPARDRLRETLQQWSLKLSEFDTVNAGLELTKASLEYQSSILLQREQDLKRREELQKIQEKQIESIKLKSEQKLSAIEIQQAALAEAWRHINYKEQELKEREKGKRADR